MDKPDSPKRIKTTETVFGIVEYVKENGGCTVTEAATDLNTSKSTLHAHLRTLDELGYLTETGGEYALGMPFLSLGGHVQHTRLYGKLYQVAKPEIDELATETNERAQIVVEENRYGYYLYQSVGDRAVMADTHIGSQIPLHSTAAGKSILAHLPDGRVEEIIDQQGLSGDTENSITDRQQLLDRLEAIRNRGYAFDYGERVVGMRCVAAPVQTDDNDILGAVSVSLPKKRSKDEFFTEDLPEMVTNAARVIGLNITYS